jgi:hypothetical protein
MHAPVRHLAIALLLASGLLVGCKKQSKPRQEPTVAQMSADEIKRSEDACNVYVERVCACAQTVPAAVEPCKLARALPDAIRIGLEVAASSESKPDIVQQSHASVRKTAKECIEQTAKLPSLPCP